MSKVSLFTQINSLPPNLREEVRDFVEFLKLKKNKSTTKRKFGFLKGKIKLSKDFDDEIEDFKEYI